VELTTVADTYIVFHDGSQVHRHDGLQPGTSYDFHGVRCTTLTPPAGELLCRVQLLARRRQHDYRTRQFRLRHTVFPSLGMAILEALQDELTVSLPAHSL
jgi:hypothetical protein